MISTITWVGRGRAKQHPVKADMSEEEYQSLMKQLDDELTTTLEDRPDAATHDSPSSTSEDTELAIYHLDTYDKDPNEHQEHPLSLFGNMNPSFMSPGEDPYILLSEEADEPDETEDLEIRSDDLILLSGRTDDDLSCLEVYIYEESEDHLYIHHDMMLSAFPLCTEWLDFNTRPDLSQCPGNFVAIGTFQSEIEVWDLDMIDPFYPHAILGKTKKSGNHKKEHEGHRDAVLSLSWNAQYRNMLVSGSADHWVKLWDLTSLKCLRTYGHHTDKIQAVQWNPNEATVLMSGSFDRRLAVFDSRLPQSIQYFPLNADIEQARWNPHDSHYILASSEDGKVTYFDIRRTDGSSVFTLHAHDKPVSALDFNPAASDMILTGSTDKLLKLWDLKNHQPSLLVSRDMDVGKLFAASFCTDSPYLISCAGGKGVLKVWNSASNTSVRTCLEDRLGRRLPEPPVKKNRHRSTATKSKEDSIRKKPVLHQHGSKRFSSRPPHAPSK